jgi:type I restriction-modification system DNA methylase subunit
MDTKTGDIIWKLTDNTETNEKYKEIKLNLQRIIKQAHDLLYSSCSVVGVKAQNDIMRVLALVIMKTYFNDESSEIYKMCLLSKDKVVGFEKHIKFCKDLSSITKEENPLNKWVVFVKKFLIHIFPAVYYEDDAKFNFTDERTFINLINIINTLEVNNDFIDAFASTCGDIHESFRAYGGGKGAKELGQFFTPRHLIHLIFHGLGLQEIMREMQDVSIYDCCMGTGAFLTRIYSLGDVKPENIYGCETEQDTIKFGEASMLLTTKSICKNIEKCDSLCENPFIHTKKMKMIVTNPPFGTKMKYKDLQKKFEERFKDASVKFKDIYPVEVNNGACLFIQHCVYMLDDGGVCAIVLPDGELFDGNSKWSKTFRKWWCETVNIIKILKVPSGTFEYTGIKTNVVIFIKNGPTQNIQFLQTNKECNSVQEMLIINRHLIAEKEYNLSYETYMQTEIKHFTVFCKKLDDICDIKYGTRIVSKNNIPGEYPVFGSGNHTFTTNTYNREGFNVVIGRFALSRECVRLMTFKFFLNDSGLTVCPKDTHLNHAYIGYYLYFNQDDIYGCSRGQGQRNLCMEKFKNLPIPVPSLDIQQEIVQELSDIEQSINTIKTRIDQLKREKDMYRKHGRTAEIRKLLKDCEMKTLGEVCELKSGKGLYEREKKVTDTHNIPYYDSNGVIGYVNTHLYDGEYIITARKLSIGSLHYITGKFYPSDNTINITKMDDNCNLTMVYYWLLYNNQYLTDLKKGIKPGIRKSEVEKIPFPQASTEIQQQCIEIYKQKETYLNELQSKIDKEKEYIEELKKLGKDVIVSYCS